MRVTIVVQPREDDWVVGTCLEMPEAISQGRSVQEAKDNVIDAINELFQSRRDDYLARSYLGHSTLEVNL